MWCANIKRTTRLAHRSRRKVGGTRDGGSGRCISGTTFFQLYFSGYWYLIETLCSVTPLGHAPPFHLSVLLLADCFSSQRRRVSRHWCLSISIWNPSLSRNLSGCRLVILVEFFFWNINKGDILENFNTSWPSGCHFYRRITKHMREVSPIN